MKGVVASLAEGAPTLGSVLSALCLSEWEARRISDHPCDVLRVVVLPLRKVWIAVWTGVVQTAKRVRVQTPARLSFLWPLPEGAR